MTHDHARDSAVPYALGLLPENETNALEAHLQHCRECAQRVAEAERDIALIASLETRHEAPPELAARLDAVLRSGTPRRTVERRAPSWYVPAALAAALIVGFLPTAYFWSESRAMHDAMLAQSAAMERVAAAPHRSAAFAPMAGGPPADVIYGRDGSGYVVVVRGTSKPLAVAWMHAGGPTMLGKTVPHGGVGMLYLTKSHRMDRLALMDGARIVGEAVLSWQRTTLGRQGVRSG